MAGGGGGNWRGKNGGEKFGGKKWREIFFGGKILAEKNLHQCRPTLLLLVHFICFVVCLSYVWSSVYHIVCFARVCIVYMVGYMHNKHTHKHTHAPIDTHTVSGDNGMHFQRHSKSDQLLPTNYVNVIFAQKPVYNIFHGVESL